MKTRIFLGMGLLFSAIGFGQNTSLPSTPVINGSDNVNIGTYTGINLSSLGDRNVFLGHSAGKATTDGRDNVFIGWRAGGVATKGSQNVAIGEDAGSMNDTVSNVFIGYQSGKVNVHGDANLFSGYLAGRSNTKGDNTFLGAQSGSNSTDSSSVFVGRSSGVNSVGARNIFLGPSSGANANGSNNVAIGHLAGRGNNSSEYGADSYLGTQNVLIGDQSGRNSSGNRNVFIGNLAGSTLTSESDLLYIENSSRTNPLIYGNFDADTREIKFNAKKVGIGFEGTAGNEGFGSFTTNLPNDEIYRLYVRGGILAEEIRIRLQDDWADYVFTKDYNLLSLNETEKYISENGHLPNMPSAAQVKNEGIELGNIVTLQQEKIEELTLHLIEQQKQIEELKAQVQLLINK